MKLSKATKERLRGLKRHPRETYEDVIGRLLSEEGAFSTSRLLERAIPYLKRHGVTSVAVFGSRARGEEGPHGDLDLLVDFARGTSLFDHVGMEMELSELLGVKVELVSRRAVSPFMREGIEGEAVAVA